MSKTETALVIVLVGAAGYFLYQRSKLNAVAPNDGKYDANNPNGQVKDNASTLDDYYNAGKTVVEGGKKVGGWIEDGIDTVKGWFS